jgi:hypothetical protein
MKKNPYAQVQFKTPVLATDLRFPGSKERAVGRDGDLNASSRQDLVMQIAKLMQVAMDTPIYTEDQMSRRELVAKHQEAIVAAFNSDQAHRELGEVMAEELYLAGNREGFMRRFLARQELTQGQIPHVRMRMKNVVATVASAPSKVTTQLIRDNLYFPPEFYISTRPFVEQREIDQSSGDVLEEKYIEGLEGMMVSEDRTWYTMCKATANIANPATTIIGTMSPMGLATLRNQVTRWNIPAGNWLIANDIWNDIIGDANFSQLIDPVSKHELLLTGQLGVIIGMTIYSDAFRHPQHKVLSQGEMFVVGDAVNHGQYTDRGGVNSAPIDGSIESVPGRGWWLTESMSIVVANARSVAYGRRV